MKKQFIVALNGMATCGKDTFCDFVAANSLSEKGKELVNSFSSVNEIKSVLVDRLGWDGVTKDEKSRAFMSELKDSWTKYNDGPFNSIKDYITSSVTADLIFIHIREPHEIEKLRQWCSENEYYFASMLMLRESAENISTNTGDLGAQDESYVYDLVVRNNGTLDDLQEKAINFSKNHKEYLIQIKDAEVQMMS